jgi:hypothetical protein
MQVVAVYSLNAHRNYDFLSPTRNLMFVNIQILLIQINVLPTSVLFALDEHLGMVYVKGACLKTTFS